MSHSDSFRKMLIGAAFFCLTCIAAVIGYTLAGWTLVDSMYMVVITIFGVGYGEVQPIDSPSLKVFTVVVIIAGCSSGIYVVGGFVQSVAEGEFHRALGVRRMSRGIEQASGHVIICGFGRVGRILADELHELNETFVCVDSNPDRIAEAEANGYLVVSGNAGEEETLTRAGVVRARVLATVLPDDAANVFITLTARELSEEIEIIARGESVATRRKLIRSGANHVVLPAAIGASKIANMISCPTPEALLNDPKQRERLQSDLGSLGLSIRKFEIASESSLIGNAIGKVKFDSGDEMMVVAIHRLDQSVLQNPDREEIVMEGDTLFVLTNESTVASLTKVMEAKRPEILYRGARLN